ncbi:FAD-dependent oxidoreductase [Flavobacterium sp. 9AF]|uniref:NAD(P)/FAD-dependent oxidoreductase n=1 Tax=Flavobacterium sp. 9AF TaxID=2653142 RepID=UPI0012F22EA9|nr:FAD-dependent oxidoreductase [Flavobacterium sp. 9AF]VXB06244.1 FAD-dependent oxidoreductase [Flavobacterium sp. 9AF]
MKDFLIVGAGIAGVSFAELCKQHNKSFVVYDDNSQPSSRIAGGLYNPVVLKRFSEVWKAKEQLQLAFPFYENLEKKLQTTFDYKIPIYRKFASVEEQNDWFTAADKPSLSDFLSTKLIGDKYASVNASYGYGEVLYTGYLDVRKLVSSYASYLEASHLFTSERFNYEEVEITNDFILYKNDKYKNIIFAEGFGMHANPYFNDLPLDGTKGELLIIEAPNLKIDVTIKSSIFILPIGNDKYKVGATYDWTDKTNIPTTAGKNELTEKLKETITCDYKIIEHFAGVRPTVKDRRPLVGTHYKHKNIHVLNGLGTRGVMLAPFLANQLFNHLVLGENLEKEIDIIRIYRKRSLI